MPDAVSQLNNVGNITKALLDALDQIESAVSQGLVGPDGKPSGSAIYMHMMNGIPIDPKDYANPWTPMEGSAAAQFGNDGKFSGSSASGGLGAGGAAPGGFGSSGAAPGAFGSTSAASASSSVQAQNEFAENAAFNTSTLVDQMLVVTENGVAVSWPDRNVSIEYFGVITSAQPLPIPPPSPEIQAEVAAAQRFLFVEDANGNLINYTPVYQNYQNNQAAWATAVANQAAAYAQAMADPIAGQVWPETGIKYATAVKQAWNNWVAMGKQQVENALNVISTEGQSPVTAIFALAKQMYQNYQVTFGGLSTGTQWSYLSPSSWWDATDDSIGALQITGSSKAHDARTQAGTYSFANNWQAQQSNSTSGSGGFNVGIYSASSSASHQGASNAASAHAAQYNWSSHQDHSSEATVSFEWFIATIYRPWLLGDIFNLKDWYVVQQRENCISDGTTKNPDGIKSTLLLPMLPKAFLIIRNIAITCDDWGDFGSSFGAAAQASQNSGQSSANSVAVSGSYLFASGSAQHQDQQSSSQGAQNQMSNNITFSSDGGKGGTLKMLGSQICGWIGQIQPAAPPMDDPTLPKKQAAAGGAAAPPTLGPVH